MSNLDSLAISITNIICCKTIYKIIMNIFVTFLMPKPFSMKTNHSICALLELRHIYF